MNGITKYRKLQSNADISSRLNVRRQVIQKIAASNNLLLIDWRFARVAQGVSECVFIPPFAIEVNYKAFAWHCIIMERLQVTGLASH